jgi:hypothetical protein
MAGKAACVCGCGRKSRIRHHVVYRQELRRVARGAAYRTLERDETNLVPIARVCHDAHHGRTKVLPLWRLPDSAFEFARDWLGAGPAYEYLRRRYTGADPRLDSLLDAA